MLRRDKLVIKKALVDLEGPAFQAYVQHRERWALHDCFRCAKLRCLLHCCAATCISLLACTPTHTVASWASACPHAGRNAGCAVTTSTAMPAAKLFAPCVKDEHVRAGALAPSNMAWDPLPTWQTSRWPSSATTDSPSISDGGVHLWSVNFSGHSVQEMLCISGEHCYHFSEREKLFGCTLCAKLSCI